MTDHSTWGLSGRFSCSVVALIRAVSLFFSNRFFNSGQCSFYCLKSNRCVVMSVLSIVITLFNLQLLKVRYIFMMWLSKNILFTELNPFFNQKWSAGTNQCTVWLSELFLPCQIIQGENLRVACWPFSLLDFSLMVARYILLRLKTLN